MIKGKWTQLSEIQPKTYTCGHSGCGKEVGSNMGYIYKDLRGIVNLAYIYICPVCERPTFFDRDSQIPGKIIGNNVEHLPPDIDKLYNEIRHSTTNGSFTLSVLGCRKLLMHIAVEQGAKENLSFVEYVNYLINNHFAPPNSQPWIDKIRQKGNEANHEIKIMTIEDAKELISFIEMLLKFIYEFPAKEGIII